MDRDDVRTVNPGSDLLSEIQLSQWHLPALAVAHRLGILAAALQRRSAADIAERAGTDPVATGALLRLLAALGACDVDSTGYRLHDMLRDELGGATEGDWGPMFRLAWDERCTMLLESVRSGDPRAFAARGGLWRGVREADWLRETFSAAMHTRSLPLARALVGAGRWKPAGTLLDVGCGSGVYSRELLRLRTGWRAILLDLPEVALAALRRIEDSEPESVGERLSALPGDMFEVDWPQVDVVLISDVLHNWNDAAAGKLLARAAAAVAEQGEVLLHDMLLDDPPVEPARAANAVSMVALTGGTQRTAGHTAELLGEVGLVVIDVYPTSHYYSVIVARKNGRSNHG